MVGKDLTIKINGIVDNHSSRRLFPALEQPGMKDPHDIVEYAWKQKVEKVGDGPDDFVVFEEPVEVSRINRQAFIAKDADQVGVLNILEKVRRSGDVTLLNQMGASIPEGVQDFTDIPNNVGDALKVVQNGSNSFEALKAIFGDISFETLAKMSPEELSSAVAAYVQKFQASAEGEK